jgi:hypothetical protein
LRVEGLQDCRDYVFIPAGTRRRYAQAGELADTGVGAVDKAAELTRAVGVAQSLLELQRALGDKLGAAGGAGAATVDKLGAMLTLSKVTTLNPKP